MNLCCVIQNETKTKEEVTGYIYSGDQDFARQNHHDSTRKTLDIPEMHFQTYRRSEDTVSRELILPLAIV
jgi:hypothetical protein